MSLLSVQFGHVRAFRPALSMTVTPLADGLAGPFPRLSPPLPSIHPSARMHDSANSLFSLLFSLYARCAAFGDGHLAGRGSGSRGGRGRPSSGGRRSRHRSGGGGGRPVSPWRACRFGSAIPSTHAGSIMSSRFTASGRRADGIAVLAGSSRRGVSANASTDSGGGDDRGAFRGVQCACPVRSGVPSCACG